MPDTARLKPIPVRATPWLRLRRSLLIRTLVTI